MTRILWVLGLGFACCAGAAQAHPGAHPSLAEAATPPMIDLPPALALLLVVGVWAACVRAVERSRLSI